MADCVDGAGMFDVFAASAAELAGLARRRAAWSATTRAGCGRCSEPRISKLTRFWARPFHRAVLDPDGRPRALRRRGEF